MQTDQATFAQLLVYSGAPDAVAVVADDRALSYAELRRLVAARRDELGLAQRSVVLLTGPTSLEWLVTYLALLDAHHVPLLAGDRIDRLVGAWDPAAIVTARPDGVDIRLRAGTDRTATALHPELALLLSTSGSTGDPKLVRLSHGNLASNALAIAEYLGLRPDDRGITSLPLHYCYGLSIVHSHLAVGASVVLTDASVVDPCFHAALERHGVTNVAGVPHTFDLLERAGSDRLHVPTLRFVTQAGGKLRRDAVERWLDRADAWGVAFYVMYGQTEATARMAYLPPDVARRHPDAIGRAIPGGHLELVAGEGDLDPDVGELVYRGPNVMLGYAVTAGDLALGRTVDELRTGDLARFHADDGVYEIVGRRARFVKPFGLRIDLDALERELSDAFDADEIVVAGDDQGIVVMAPGLAAGRVRHRVAEHTGLPAGAVAAVTDTPVPRTESGKPDYAAALERRRADPPTPRVASDTTRAEETAAAIIADVLGRDDVTDDDTFVSLGGDSLSYVECSIRLEAALGRTPDDWHVTPLGELVGGRPRTIPTIDTTVVLRAIGICAVVATHMHLAFVPGGAHLLLAVVGYNLSRFLLPITDTSRRVRAGLRTAARAAVPTVVWIAIGAAAGASHGIGTLLLVNNYVGPRSHSGDHWHFWFIEVFVHLVLAATLLLAIPSVRRADRLHPYAVPLAVFVVLLVLRLEWAQMGDWYNLRYRTHGVAWFFALGWLIHRSGTFRTRLATSALCVATIPGFFDYAPREWFITTCLLVLIWWRDLWFPRIAIRPVAALAAASMWIYISHFTIWPPMIDLLGVRMAYVATLLAGVGVWVVAERVQPVVTRAMRRHHDVVHRPSLVRMT